MDNAFLNQQKKCPITGPGSHKWGTVVWVCGSHCKPWLWSSWNGGIL